MSEKTAPEQILASESSEAPHKDEVGLINASGHKQELERNFSLLSICAVAIITGNTWAGLAGTLTVAIYNGGPPGVIYEFIAISAIYWFIGASIAELSSSLPSAGGVYHWASLTPSPRYRRICGWFAGWWNCAAWVFACASMCIVLANQLVSMYGMFHPDFTAKSWQIFIAYVIVTWLCTAVVMFGNRLLPTLNTSGMILSIAGVFVTLIVCAIMPSQNGEGYADSDFVWKTFQNSTGWSNNGLVFMMGMVNGAYSVGTTDCVTHMAEEIPRPETNVPKAIGMQCLIGFTTTICYLVAVFYSIHDLDAVLSSSSSFPLTEIYRQATGSRGGAFGLLIVIFLPSVVCTIGCYITASRTFWTLARDNATPFSGTFGRVSHKWHNPFYASLLCGVVCTILGCIYVGSAIAFNAFVGSYAVLSTLSYVAAILPNVLTGRRNLKPGAFHMRGWIGFAVNGFSCLVIFLLIIVFCFPDFYPVDAVDMNYSSLIAGAVTIFVGAWYLWRGRTGYDGPQALEAVAAGCYST